jgi:uncharacterized protein YtpQ (UPF0354 family)
MSKPSRIQFLDQVEQLIAKRFPSVKLQRSEADFSLRVNGNWASLENLYRVSVAENATASYADRLSRNVEQWVVELLHAMEQSPDELASYEELRPRILPVVVAKISQVASGIALVSQQLLDRLAVGYVIDDDKAMSYISVERLEQWNIPLDELHETAISNLIARSEMLQAHAAQDDEGKINLILIQTMDGYDASRILLPGLYDRLREYLGAPFVAGIPNRDILVCFRDDPETVSRLRERILQDFRTMPYQVTDELFLVTADGIASYNPVEDRSL